MKNLEISSAMSAQCRPATVLQYFILIAAPHERRCSGFAQEDFPVRMDALKEQRGNVSAPGGSGLLISFRAYGAGR